MRSDGQILLHLLSTTIQYVYFMELILSKFLGCEHLWLPPYLDPCPLSQTPQLPCLAFFVVLCTRPFGVEDMQLQCRGRPRSEMILGEEPYLYSRRDGMLSSHQDLEVPIATHHVTTGVRADLAHRQGHYIYLKSG